MATTTPSVEHLRARVRELLPAVQADLEALVRIPSVSLDAFDQAHVDASAAAVARLLEAEGLAVEIVREGGRPAVIGHRPGPEGAPTVTLYAHHDVQPPGPREAWESEPFEPTRRGDRLYGRGAADDKAGVMAHVAALRALGDDLAVGVTVFVEGEEEIGSPSLGAILERHGDRLAADAIVLADSANWRIGVPALTTTLRGMVRLTVTVRTLDHGVHSGLYGGAVPDATTTLVRLLATLHDASGEVAVTGLQSGATAALDYDEDQLRAESGLLAGVRPIGTGRLLERLWSKPAITIIGMDVPDTATAANLLAPSAAAKLSVRLHPDEDPMEAYEAVAAHLRAHAPWGAVVEVRLDDAGSGFTAPADGAALEIAREAFTQAYGAPCVDIGMGGSIPFVKEFADAFPQAQILITGVEDPDTRAHGANESLHLPDFESACLAEALLLARLGAAGA